MNYSSILITGASSGIGRSLAKLLAKPGVTLCLMGRNVEHLQSITNLCKEAGADVHFVAVDATQAEEMRSHILAYDRENPIDLVIANAGIGSAQSADQNLGVVDNIQIIKTNILSIHYTLDPIIEKFKEREHGQIAIMSSIGSFRGFAKYYVYCATKAYARIYGQGLRLDLKRYHIQVSTIAPGFVKTPLTDRNTFKMPLIMSADKAAQIIIKGLNKNKSLIAFPKIYYFLCHLIACLPAKLADFIAERVI